MTQISAGGARSSADQIKLVLADVGLPLEPLDEAVEDLGDVLDAQGPALVEPQQLGVVPDVQHNEVIHVEDHFLGGRVFDEVRVVGLVQAELQEQAEQHEDFGEMVGLGLGGDRVEELGEPGADADPRPQVLGVRLRVDEVLEGLEAGDGLPDVVGDFLGDRQLGVQEGEQL